MPRTKVGRAAYERAVARLRKSEKFKSYTFKSKGYAAREPVRQRRIPGVHAQKEAYEPLTEKHFAPAELAEVWGVSVETVREMFRHEPGVLKLGSTGAKYRRGYVTLRIPRSVAERVHRRESGA
jgi:hypothetical protein